MLEEGKRREKFSQESLSRTLMHGSLSGKIKFRGYHRFRVNGSCYTFFLALKNGRIPFPPPSWSLSSQFGKIRHVFFPRANSTFGNDSRSSTKFISWRGRRKGDARDVYRLMEF